MDFEKLAEIASTADTIEEDIKAYCAEHKATIPECINGLSLYVAQNYSKDLLSYEFADDVMNLVWGHMTEDFVLNACDNILPEPAYAIYLAFDSGEYHHRGDEDSVDPVKKYTDPEIAEILENEQNT